MISAWKPWPDGGYGQTLRILAYDLLFFLLGWIAYHQFGHEPVYLGFR